MSNRNKSKITLGKKILRYFWSFIIVAFLTCFCGLIVFGILINYWLKDCPELDTSVFHDVAQTSYIYDANDNIITNYSNTENREWVQINNIPNNLKNAFVAVEDQRFYNHSGVDIKRLGGAILHQIIGDDIYGGSTITQQLIKNTILTDVPTYKRKVQEIYLALQLEKTLSKDEILEAYLNIIYLGGTNYGVKTAAIDYFNKDLSQLSLKECALIAGLTQNPYDYNPRANMYSRDAFDKNERRTKVVLNAMKKNGYITEEEYNNALNEEIYIQPYSSSSNMYDYAHFVEYAIDDVVDGFLIYRNIENTSENRTKIENEIRNGGYNIHTTLDVNLQNKLQESIIEYNNYPTFLDEPLNIEYEIDPLQPQVAAVIIDQHTGNIVAMIGSRTPPQVKKSFNRATDSIMAVGSIIKPISVFGPALDLGRSPASIEYDYPDNIIGYDETNSYPKTSKTTNSSITMREAIKQSLNIPTARELCYHVGIDKASAYLIRLGIPGKSLTETSAGLALGTDGINILSMTAAYATIANDGNYLEPRSYTVVTDANGKVILNAEDVKKSRNVFKKSTSYLLTDMLIDVVESGTGTKAKIPNITVAGKTGTNEQNSLTFAGYTGYYTSAVWIGHDACINFSDKIEAGDYAAPLWQDYMAKIHENLIDKDIISSEGLNIKEATICKISGKLATENCGENIITDIFNEEDIPTEECNMHTPIKICSITNQISSEYCPTVYETSGLFIPSNSELNTINHDLIKQYLDVTFEDDVTVDNNSTCLVHKEGYVTISYAEITQAKELKQSLQELLNLNILDETYSEYCQIHIDNLEYLISTANRIVDANETNNFYETFKKTYKSASEFYEKFS